MIHVFSEQLSPRLFYTLDFIFTARGLEYYCTSDWEKFTAIKGPKLNYSEREASDSLKLSPSTLLFENNVRSYAIDQCEGALGEVMSFDGVPDLLASIFFVLSRYEEHWPTERDQHDRFKASNSIQSLYGWLKKPICDEWAEALVQALRVAKTPDRTFSIEPTFDIDATFAYREKGLVRNGLGLMRDLLFGRFKRVSERIAVLSGQRRDPFDTFDRMAEIAAAHANTQCFWLMSDYGAYHKNLPYDNGVQAEVLRKMAQQCAIGIHPGYGTYTNPSLLSREKLRLEAVLEASVSNSRQHFLQFKLPETYEHLCRENILVDYSMGYADQPGFRMGTARRTPWYNLRTNEESALQLQPFCFMDGTLNEYMGLTPEQAQTEVQALKAAVQRNGGTFCFIWHNETLGFQYRWQGWGTVLLESLKP
ncbi:MAG: polysaccharide deacetylase family protein [Bacteroidetes bacterium]|nr:polysaccharide deacetylase family protein [Bacteroidota bacterium]MBM3424515.1 hypothetical protein [Bacteroidota bacterium]